MQKRLLCWQGLSEPTGCIPATGSCGWRARWRWGGGGEGREARSTPCMPSQRCLTLPSLFSLRRPSMYPIPTLGHASPPYILTFVHATPVKHRSLPFCDSRSCCFYHTSSPSLHGGTSPLSHSGPQCLRGALLRTTPSIPSRGPGGCTFRFGHKVPPGSCQVCPLACKSGAARRRGCQGRSRGEREGSRQGQSGREWEE